MKLKLEHAFACTPEEYWDIVADHTVDEQMAHASDGTYELLSESDANGVLTRRQRIVMNRELPSAMKKAIGTDKIGYELETKVQRSANRADWTITPLVLPDRVKGAGIVHVTATPSGCVRVIDGELTVKVPLIGKMMEERLVNDVSASYDRGAEIIRQHIGKRKGA